MPPRTPGTVIIRALRNSHYGSKRKGGFVAASRIQFLSKERHIPFFAAPEVRSADHPWTGYDFEESVGDGVPLPSHSWSKTTLLYVCHGSSSLRWKHRGVWSHDPIERGTVSIVRRDVEIQAAVPGGSFPMMVLQLDNAKLQHLAPAQILSIDETLVAAQVTRDARLSNLLSAMRAEVKEGCLSGRLYAEAISIALLAYLANKYCVSRRDASGACLLSQSQKRRIDDYIRESLTDNISVSELASLVHMSPSYFSRVFKASFGETPYHFVMRQRIEAAKVMLADPKLTATGIASALGFASQSHFVKVFRQFTSVTPRRYRIDAKLPFA
jgi:AraC family transcriptional regulator